MRNTLRFVVILASLAAWSVLIAGEAQAQILVVPQEYQEQTNWCWAASCRAIIKYYGNLDTLQCHIVNWVRVQKGWGSDDCCNPAYAGGSSCNRGNWLYFHPPGHCKDVLENYGSIYEGKEDTLSRPEVTQQMTSNHPVMIRFDWWSGGAHALILHGFTSETDMVNLMDPWYGSYVADYDWVVHGSAPGHTWTRNLIGVDIAATGGVDVVFIVDVTGSTATRRQTYDVMIRALANLFENFSAASRYALTYHMDFPLNGYGSGSDVAYGIKTDFVDAPGDLDAHLDDLPDGAGADTPESQYTAVHQAITGSGVDLNDDYDYADLGEIAQTPLSYSSGNVKAYYLFTYPVDFHNSDDESQYPEPHSVPVPPYDESTDYSCSRRLTLLELANLMSKGMLFGVTIIPGAAGDKLEQQGGPVAHSMNDLMELAVETDGTVYEIADSIDAEQAAVESYEWFWDHISPLEPAAVLISSFLAIERAGFVEVTWTTTAELANAGFNVYRGTSEYDIQKLNSTLIPSRGSKLKGAVYSFRDEGGAGGTADLYWLEDVSVDGETRMNGPVLAGRDVTPRAFGLSQNFPNPFNPITEIRYDLPVACHVKLEIFNVLGQRVATLVDAYQTAGSEIVRWNAGKELSSGLYFYRLQAGSFIEIKKMVLLR